MFYNVKILKYRDGIVDTRIYNHCVAVDHIKKVGKKKYKRKNAEEDNTRRSVSRSKQTIYELARNGVWEWFVTLTFDGEKVDRYDYSLLSKKLSVWLMNLRKKAPDLQYLLVPELHKDGAYHFHGLMSNLENCKITDSGRMAKGKPIYNLGSYRFGFSTMTRVEDNAAVTRYIAKYVTKDLLKYIGSKKRYWASRNLERPEVQLLELSALDRCGLWQELEEDCVYSNVASSEYLTAMYYQNKG